MLERFLFPPALQWTPIAKLSGGEKRRLYLLRVLMGAPNVILLDEPTNDLDLRTLTILESYLEDFSGAVIVVSHDRYFIDRVAEKIFAFEGDGQIEIYFGNYSDYSQKKEEIPKAGSGKERPEREERDTRSKSLKFSYKEQKEFEQIDEKIADLEKRIKETDKEINDAAMDYELLKRVLGIRAELEAQLNETMERWIYLNELAEKIAEGKKE